MKLTAQDLMIGDLVRTLDSTHKEKVYAKIWAIEEGQTSILVKKDICNWFVDIEWIEPIPITPEILDKNGFEKIEEKNYATPILEKHIESINVLLGERQHYVKIVVDSQVGNETEFFTFLGKAKYVHQLQQAMRLCKIRKEIKL